MWQLPHVQLFLTLLCLTQLPVPSSNSSLITSATAPVAAATTSSTTPLPAVIAALHSIIRELFAPKMSSFMISLPRLDSADLELENNSMQFHANWRITDTLSQLLHELNFIKVQIESVHCQRSCDIHTRKYNLIIVDSAEALSRLNVAAYTLNSDFVEYYLVQLLPTWSWSSDAPTLLNASDVIANIFSYFWSHYLPNVSLLYETAPHIIEVYTYYVYTSPRMCGQVVVRHINRYAGQWQRNLSTHIFPQKFQNLNGCSLRIALWHIPPYIIWPASESDQLVGGFEGIMLCQLARRLNFSLNVIVPADGTMRGQILANGSGTGAIKMLYEHSADLSLGCFRYTLERSELLTGTLPYYQTPQTYSVLLSVHGYTSLHILVFPFQPLTWLCLLLTLLLNIALGKFCYQRLLHKISQLPRVQHLRLHAQRASMLQLISLFFGLPVPHEPRSCSGRLLLLLWLLFGLLMRTAYQSLLFQLLQTDLYSRAPRSLDELRQQGYGLLMTRNTYDTVSQVPDLLRNRIPVLVSNESSEDSTYEHMVRHSQSLFAGVSPLDFLTYYINRERSHGAFYVLPEIVFTQHIAMYFSKHSYLAARFDALLQRLRYFGLIDYWARQHTDHTAYRRDAASKLAQRIGLRHVAGVFWLYLLLNTLACGVFVLELSWPWLQTRWRRFTLSRRRRNGRRRRRRRRRHAVVVN